MQTHQKLVLIAEVSDYLIYLRSQGCTNVRWHKRIGMPWWAVVEFSTEGGAE